MDMSVRLSVRLCEGRDCQKNKSASQSLLWSNLTNNDFKTFGHIFGSTILFYHKNMKKLITK